MSGWPPPDDLAALHAFAVRYIRSALAESRMIDEQAEQLEARVSAIEEVLAARWPRRWLLAARLGRRLRASVRHLGYAGGFAQRRAEDASLAVHPGPAQRCPVIIDTGEFQAIERRPAEVLADVADWAADRTSWGADRQPPPVIRMLVEHALERGAEVWAHDFGHALLNLRHEGASDADLIAAALEMIGARMTVGLPHEGWFTPDGAP